MTLFHARSIPCHVFLQERPYFSRAYHDSGYFQVLAGRMNERSESWVELANLTSSPSAPANMLFLTGEGGRHYLLTCLSWVSLQENPSGEGGG